MRDLFGSGDVERKKGLQSLEGSRVSGFNSASGFQEFRGLGLRC